MNLDTTGKGGVGEAKFLAKAVGLGHAALIPWSENRPYDIVLESQNRFARVQVKSTFVGQVCRGGRNVRYQCTIDGYNKKAGQTKRLDLKSIDFLACYLAPVDLWYIIPVSFLDRSRKRLFFFPHLDSRSLLEQFRERWDLLDGVALPM